MAHHIPNRGPELLGVDITFLITALIANVLRCYVRIRMVKAFGPDDWLMVIATLSFMLYGAFSIAGVHYGTGRHHSDLPLEDVHRAKNYWWCCYLFFCITMIASKVSIGWFLLRIAFKKMHVWIIYAATLITVVAGAAFFFVTLFQCRPISYFWNKSQPGTCVPDDVVIALGYLYSTFSIISDFTFAILPAFLVWNLQLNFRTKMALIPLLTMGCIASCAVVARVPYMGTLRSNDFLWATVDIAIWSTVEQGLAVTAGSLATLRPLFQMLSHRLGLSTGPTSHAHPSRRYGAASPSASQILGGRRKKSQDMLDRYKLSNFAEAGSSKAGFQENIRESPSPNWFQTSFTKSSSKKKTLDDNESEKSLHTESKNSMEDGMQIMVSKSFIITNEHKS